MIVCFVHPFSINTNKGRRKKLKKEKYFRFGVSVGAVAVLATNTKSRPNAEYNVYSRKKIIVLNDKKTSFLVCVQRICRKELSIYS